MVLSWGATSIWNPAIIGSNRIKDIVGYVEEKERGERDYTLLCAVCCVLYAVCCMLYIVYCILYVVCSVLCVCCVLIQVLLSSFISSFISSSLRYNNVCVGFDEPPARVFVAPFMVLVRARWRL